MKTLALWVAGYLLNSLWMVPLLFGFAWLAARWMRRAGPQMEHGVWLSALLLEIVLPACAFREGALRWLSPGGTAGDKAGAASVAMTAGTGAGHGAVVLPGWLTMGALAIYGGVLLYFGARLGWGLWATWRMRRTARPVELTDEAATVWLRCRRAFAMDAREVGIASSSRVAGPVTVGIRRGAVLLPERFAERVEASDFSATIAHECAHVQRRDFVKNVLYRGLALPVSYHPLLWLTLSRIAETREMICDAMAAEAMAGRESYARSLLRLASQMPHAANGNLHAIGILDASSFERRVMSLTGNKTTMGRVRRLAMVAACGVTGMILCGSAMALRMHVETKAVASPDRVDTAKTQDGVTMPQLISSVEPEYPKLAKKDRVNGNCLLMLTVDREGIPQDVHIVRSLRPDFDQKAIEAVEQYRFKPAMKDGQPFEKQLNVEVSFRIF